MKNKNIFFEHSREASKNHKSHTLRSNISTSFDKRPEIKLSIIVVHYKASDELNACLDLIAKQKTTFKFEVIIVDHDADHPFVLNSKQKVKVVHHKNNGFGGGNNFGAAKAKGKYLFFLNPDTLLKPGCLQKLVGYLEENDGVGIVAPTLLDTNGKRYELQGSKILTPLLAITTQSIFSKFIPNSLFFNYFWMINHRRDKVRHVEVVPGSAFVISSDLFRKLKGFDQNFFLYFEEFDLCKRVRDLNKKIVMLAEVKVIHHWGRSTESLKNNNQYFQHSRKYYLQKHFGWRGSLAQALLLVNKYHIVLVILAIVLLTIYIVKFYA